MILSTLYFRSYKTHFCSPDFQSCHFKRNPLPKQPAFLLDWDYCWYYSCRYLKDIAIPYNKTKHSWSIFFFLFLFFFPPRYNYYLWRVQLLLIKVAIWGTMFSYWRLTTGWKLKNVSYEFSLKCNHFSYLSF